MTRSAPGSSPRERPRSRVRPARSASGDERVRVRPAGAAVAVDRDHHAVLARHLPGQAHRHQLRDAAVVEAAAVDHHRREHAREAARRAHGLAHVAFAEDDRLAGVDVGRQHGTGTRRLSKRGDRQELVDQQAQPRARQQAAAPAAHPHPGMEARGLVHQVVAGPRLRPRPPPPARRPRRRRCPPPAPPRAPAPAARPRARPRGPAAGQRQEEGLHAERRRAGLVDHDAAWISCRLTTSSARSRRAWIACTVAAAAVSVVTTSTPCSGGALADGAVVVERLAAERRVEDDVDLAALDQVHAVRPALVDLVDHLGRHAVRRSGSPRCPRWPGCGSPSRAAPRASGSTPGLSLSLTLMNDGAARSGCGSRRRPAPWRTPCRSRRRSPITSPVDFISGPSRMSAPGNFRNGNTDSLTKMRSTVQVLREALLRPACGRP